MQLNSSAFRAGGAIPAKYTCEGENVSPEFSWRDAPAGTKTFAFVIHDPDAPRSGGFTHWVVYNIPASTGHLGEGVPKRETVPGMEGKNDSGEIVTPDPVLRAAHTGTSRNCMPWTRS
jgi:Raf kinase inhibitor-like YbhB/YbcL family protein